jgi:hypothetical protein
VPQRRSTKAEREYRVRKLMQLIKNGWDNNQLRDYAAEEFGLKETGARNLVDAAYDTIVTGMSQLDRKRIAAICLVRFENAYRLAASQRNPMAMIQANAQIAQHWVKHAPEITYSEQVSSDALDPEEDF